MNQSVLNVFYPGYKDHASKWEVPEIFLKYCYSIRTMGDHGHYPGSTNLLEPERGLDPLNDSFSNTVYCTDCAWRAMMHPNPKVSESAIANAY